MGGQTSKARGARGACGVRNFLIAKNAPNPVPSQCLENCTTICQEVKNVSRRDQLTLVVHHEEFKHADDTFIKLYTVK